MSGFVSTRLTEIFLLTCYLISINEKYCTLYKLAAVFLCVLHLTQVAVSECSKAHVKTYQANSGNIRRR